MAVAQRQASLCRPTMSAQLPWCDEPSSDAAQPHPPKSCRSPSWLVENKKGKRRERVDRICIDRTDIPHPDDEPPRFQPPNLGPHAGRLFGTDGRTGSLRDLLYWNTAS